MRAVLGVLRCWKRSYIPKSTCVAATLCIAICTACHSQATRVDERVLVGTQNYGKGILVFDERGSQVLSLPNRDGLVFYAPSPHPDQESIVAVRCEMSHEQRADWPYDVANCVVVRSSTDGKVQVLYRPERPEMKPDSPVWSPDGVHLAFLLGSAVVVWSEAERDVVLEIQDPLLREASPEWGVAGGDYLRWGVDGQLFAHVWADGSRRIGSVDTKSRQILWQDLGVAIFPRGKVRAPLPDTDAIRAIFGSASQPVERPTRSPSGRYVFYETHRGGLFANGWVEVYDSKGGARFRLASTWRSLYSE